MDTPGYAFAPVLDLGHAAALRNDLLALRGRPLTIDASAVERLGGLGLQVILAARKTWEEDGQSLTLASASDAFTAQWIAFGADPTVLHGDAV